MNDKIIISLIEKTLKEKLINDSNFIRYTFYELRVKYNLSEEETDRFLELIKIKLQNENYDVFFPEAEFVYNNVNMTVGSNELMIGIKKNLILNCKKSYQYFEKNFKKIYTKK